MTSPESTEGGEAPQEVWLSGHELIHFTDDLLGLNSEAEERGAGYTTRLAVKAVYMALKVPGSKVVVKDHFKSPEANRYALQLVQGLLDYLRVDYDVGTEGSMKNFDHSMWVRVRRLRGKQIPKT